ncbi:MAG: TIGR00701 family protein [Woeseia sp.]|nr:TIGR00701 family protein [Woeseia sp.]NNL55469.1 TIGR00701 family protein [Woeseia sp.]
MIQWYPYLKAIHVAFMVTWFAGLFYLPRLFIYHCEANDQPSLDRFQVMERRLYAIMTLGAVTTILFGLLMLWLNSSLLDFYWFRLKLLLLAGLIVYHLRCRHWITRLANDDRPTSTRWLRWFNEIPVIFLLGIVGLAVIKPL